MAVIGLKGLPSFGGAATVGENIIEQLKDKYDFTVYSVSSHTNNKTGKYNGIKQIVFNQKKRSGLNTLVYYTKSVFHCLLVKEYDIIHLHHNAVSFFIPILRLKYKVVLTTHGLFTEEKFYYLKHVYKIFDSIFLRFANFITTVSKEDYRLVQKFKNSGVTYIPNGINMPLQSYPLYENENDYILFAAGRIHRGKGCHIFLHALKDMSYNGRVIIAGDIEQNKDYKEELLDLAKNIPNIIFVGMIKDREKLFSLVSNAKLFIYPSHAEAMSIMMLEVSSLQTPMICCNCQVNRDLFDESEVLFAERGNIKDWKEKIEWALANPEGMKLLAQTAFENIKSKHLWADLSISYSNVYDSLLT